MSQRQVELNRGLARCSLASDVLALVGASVGEFNVVNCGTALGRLARAPDGRRALGDARVASLLDAAASLVARHARHVESRQLASILHACGKLGLRVDHRASSSDASRGDVRDAPGGGGSASDPPSASAATRRLADAVESASQIHADKFNAQELANAAWGAARLGARLDRPLVRTLCDAIARSLADDASASETTRGPRAAAAAAWTPQGISNAAWSLATMGAKLDALERANANANARAALVAVFAQLARRARELNPQEVANAAWAVAKTCEEEDEDEDEKDDKDGRDGDDRDRSRERGGTGFEPSREGASLRDAARRAARALLGASGPVTPGWHASRGFEPRHAANAAWASAKVGKTLGVEALFPPAMHRALRDAAGRMNAQELAMALWALAETETAEEHRSIGASEETKTNATRDEEETAAAGISSASAARRSRSSLGASTLDALASAFARAASSATPRQLATGLRALAASGLTLSVADAKALANAVAATFGKDVPLSAESPHGGGGTTTTTRVVPHEARDLANAFWALAKLEWRAETAAFDALSAAARRRVRASRRARRRERTTGASSDASSNDSRVGNSSSSFAPRELATIVWSHGMLGRGDDARLLDACAKEARATLGDFAGRDLSDFAHGLDALGVDAAAKPNLLRRVAKAARKNLRRGTFNAQALLKFLGAFGRMGAEDAKLAAALRERRRVELRFPALAQAEASAAKSTEADDPIDLGAGGGAATSADDRIARVSLISATPESFRADARKNEARVDDSCGGFGRGNTGVALWEGAFVLAEWVSRRGGRCSAGPSSGWGPGGGWRGKVVVELGAGLGLPSIVASRLGAEVIATDGTRASFWAAGFRSRSFASFGLYVFRSFGFGTRYTTRFGLFSAKEPGTPLLITPLDLFPVSLEFLKGRR